jgi:hypothetical protein
VNERREAAIRKILEDPETRGVYVEWCAAFALSPSKAPDSGPVDTFELGQFFRTVEIAKDWVRQAYDIDERLGMLVVSEILRGEIPWMKNKSPLAKTKSDPKDRKERSAETS